MLELLALLALVFIILLFFKAFFFFFKIGFWALTLPLQIIAGVIGLIIVLVIAVPLALAAGFVGLLMAPFALFFALLPFVLIAYGLYLLLKE